MVDDVMSWLTSKETLVQVPLFETDENGIVKTQPYGQEKMVLKRHPKMEKAVIELVETNLAKSNWDGILYIMAFHQDDRLIPLYVGKTEKRGTKHSISANIANIKKNTSKFARWGDGLDYHIGDLSHVVLNFKAYREPRKKYKRWAETLFLSSSSLKLRQPVDLLLLPWFDADKGPSGLGGSLPAIEKEVISLAGYQYSDYILNVDGV